MGVRIPLHIPLQDQSPQACQARYALALAMSAANPKGFRTPSGKRHSRPSLVERTAIAAGQMEPPVLERSARGLRKLAARRAHIGAVKERRGGEPRDRSASKIRHDTHEDDFVVVTAGEEFAIKGLFA